MSNQIALVSALEQMGDLPGNLLLTGGDDSCAALIGSPDLLQSRKVCPLFPSLSAIEGAQESTGYHF